VLGVAISLTVLDLFVVNVALFAMAADFSGASLASLSWVLTAYAIAFAAVLVPAGKLGDLFGRPASSFSGCSSSWPAFFPARSFVSVPSLRATGFATRVGSATRSDRESGDHAGRQQ
jgi:MFS family permease